MNSFVWEEKQRNVGSPPPDRRGLSLPDLLGEGGSERAAGESQICGVSGSFENLCRQDFFTLVLKLERVS